MKKKKTVTWASLTRIQRRLIRIARRNGILLTPEQIVKMHPQLHYWPTGKQAKAFLFSFMDEHGHFRPFMEGRNMELDMAGTPKKNLDFKELARAENLSLNLNLKRGFLSVMMHGGVHFMAQPINQYNEENILAVFLAKHFQRLGHITYRGQLRNKLMEKVRRVFEELEIAKAEREDLEL